MQCTQFLSHHYKQTQGPQNIALFISNIDRHKNPWGEWGMYDDIKTFSLQFCSCVPFSLQLCASVPFSLLFCTIELPSVLLVEVVHVWHQVLHHIHVGQGVDLQWNNMMEENHFWSRWKLKYRWLWNMQCTIPLLSCCSRQSLKDRQGCSLHQCSLHRSHRCPPYSSSWNPLAINLEFKIKYHEQRS